jgi:hypothetical protein
MFQLDNFRLRPLSFWLGFVLASLFWLLVALFRRLWPGIRSEIVQRFKELRDRNLSGLETYLRRDTIQRVQKMHLAAPLFALDEILVEPRVIAPPLSLKPNELPPQETFLTQVLPYLPDFPLLPSQYGVPALSLSEALQNGANLALIGEPGAGKSVALAHLAQQVARRQAAPGANHLVPIYGHILDFELFVEANPDPVDLLRRFVTKRALVIYQGQVRSFLRATLSEGRALLIVDGLDELLPEQLAIASAFFKSLAERYPSIRMVTAANPDYLNGLVNGGFCPVTLAAWNHTQVETFIQQWGQRWDELIAPQLAANNGHAAVDTRLMVDWLEIGAPLLTPLEWTARAWALFSGAVVGPLPVQALEAYIRLALQQRVPVEMVTALAAALMSQKRSYLTYLEIEKLLARIPLKVADAEEDGQAEKPRRLKRKDAGQSSAAKAITLLLETGLLREYLNERIAFASPVLTGFFASLEEPPSATPDPALVTTWSPVSAWCHYQLARNTSLDWIDDLTASDHSPLQRGLLHAGRFLKDVPAASQWRIDYLRLLVQLLQNDSIPLPVRARMISIFAGSNEASASVLFRQLFGSNSSSVRQLAALGAGAIRDTKATSDLIALLADPSSQVRYAACLALANLPGEMARDAVAAALIEGEEDLRLVAAESFASHPPEGYTILKEAAQSPDLLVRRVAVFGLAQIKEPWVYPLLEKIAIEDGQWVVRNAASQAIDTLQHANPYPPSRKPPITEAGWLIEYASRKGQGVSRDESPVPLLLSVLRDGSYDEKRAAVEYLRMYPEPDVITRLYDLLYSEQADLAEAATTALWQIAAAGVTLPAPIEYGYA